MLLCRANIYLYFHTFFSCTGAPWESNPQSWHCKHHAVPTVIFVKLCFVRIWNYFDSMRMISFREYYTATVRGPTGRWSAPGATTRAPMITVTNLY